MLTRTRTASARAPGGSGAGSPVSALRAARVSARASRSAQATSHGEGRPSLVEGNPREAEGGGRPGHRVPIGVDAAEHLVLDLDQVAGVEERVAAEERIADVLRAGVERTGGAERGALLVGAVFS